MNECKVIVAVNDKDEVLFKNHRSNALKGFLGSEVELDDDGSVKLTNIKSLDDKFVKSQELEEKLSVFVKTKPELLVQSPLYTNRYYRMQDFDEEYRRDLDDIMYKLARRMGAKSYERVFVVEFGTKKAISFLSKIKALLTKPQEQGNGKFILKFERGESKDLSKKENFDRTTPNPQHDSIEELQAFISDKCIDIRGLSEKFRDEVERYIKKKDISGIFSHEENIKFNSKKLTELNLDLCVKANANGNDFLGKAFSGFKDLNNFNYASSIKYTIEFAPKL